MKILSRRSLLAKTGSILFLSNTLQSVFAAYGSEKTTDSCELNTNVDRILTDWDWNNYNYAGNSNSPGIELRALYRQESQCVLKVFRTPGRHMQLEANSSSQFVNIFMVKDNGNTWHPENPADRYSNPGINRINFSNMNRLNSVYTTVSNCTDKILWSYSYRNGFELCWVDKTLREKITPQIKGGHAIDSLALMSAGSHNEARVYAEIRLPRSTQYDGIYRSDDFGRNFSKVTDEMLFLTEHRADQNILIGVTQTNRDTHHEIAVSRDGGVVWNRVQDDIVSERVFQNPKTGVIRTKRENQESIGLFNINPVVQIESDPTDANTFYVVTWTGVYVTHNLGKKFRLLPIAHDYLYGVDTMAVNPCNPRCLFASVKKSELYRSLDRGCTWQKLSPPAGDIDSSSLEKL